MILPDGVVGWKDGATPVAASLYRKDSTKGYTLDNVEFVCHFISLGKNTCTAQQVHQFIADLRCQ